MKVILQSMIAMSLLLVASSSYAWFGNNNGPWGGNYNPYDEWDPRYWMEEMENEFDDNDDYYGPPPGYYGGGPGYGYGPGPGSGYGYGPGPGYGSAPRYGSGPGYGYGPGPGYGPGAYGPPSGYEPQQPASGSYGSQPGTYAPR